jgi:hypothetical protein
MQEPAGSPRPGHDKDRTPLEEFKRRASRPACRRPRPLVVKRSGWPAGAWVTWRSEAQPLVGTNMIAVNAARSSTGAGRYPADADRTLESTASPTPTVRQVPAVGRDHQPQDLIMTEKATSPGSRIPRLPGDGDGQDLDGTGGLFVVDALDLVVRSWLGPVGPVPVSSASAAARAAVPHPFETPCTAHNS